MIFRRKRNKVKNRLTLFEYLFGPNWYWISRHRKLSEKFIEKHKDEIDWYYIVKYQELSEKFIEKHKDKVDWNCISGCQKLSEKFIEKYQDKVYWNMISIYQKLSEKFIEKHKDKVDWNMISIYQILSEKFIEKFKDRVYWSYISKYQILSEEYWYNVSRYQILSPEFRKKHNLKVPKTCWLYKTKEEKLDYIKKHTNYKVINDEYVIAYKSTRRSGASVFNNQYRYKVGKWYESNCDCNISMDKRKSFRIL